MKILQVTNGFPPRNKAGVEILTYNISKELSKKYEVHVLYPVYRKGSGIYLKSFINKNLYIHEIIIGINLIKYLKDFILFEPDSYALSYENKRIEKIFEEVLLKIKPTVVHFQHLIGLSVSLPLIAKKYYPTILSLNDFWLICPTTHFLRTTGEICRDPSPRRCSECLFLGFLNRIQERVPFRVVKMNNNFLKIYITCAAKNIMNRALTVKHIINNVDKIIIPSRTVAEKFIENNFLSETDLQDRAVILHHGVNTRDIKKLKRVPSSKLRFGFVGSPSYRKGVHVLIKAFKALKTKDAELLIYGSFNPAKDAYHRFLLEISKDVPNIKFMGSFNELKEPYSNIDVLVYPSITFEGYGLAVQEAFAAKIPVIASNIGALNEFVMHMKNGLLFEPGDPDSLAEKMQMLIENPRLIEKLAGGIGTVKSIEDYVIELENIYKEIINIRGHRL